MKYQSTMLVAIFCMASMTSAKDGRESATAELFTNSPQHELRWNLQNEMAQESVPETGAAATKSVGKGVLMSAVLPGAGQFYAGSKIKGAAFLAIEAISLIAHFKYDAKGNDLEDEFEAAADAEWSEEAYWDWISQVSNITSGSIDDLRKWEHDHFSHFLPEKKGQQYYENVGKYNQFIIGWRDFREQIVGSDIFTYDDYLSSVYNGESLLTISPTRNDYTETRKDANDNFKHATTFGTITLLNHVAAALDAGLTIKRNNTRIDAQLGFRGLRYEDELVSALWLGVTW